MTEERRTDIDAVTELSRCSVCVPIPTPRTSQINQWPSFMESRLADTAVTMVTSSLLLCWGVVRGHVCMWVCVSLCVCVCVCVCVSVRVCVYGALRGHLSYIWDLKFVFDSYSMLRTQEAQSTCTSCNHQQRYGCLFSGYFRGKLDQRDPVFYWLSQNEGDHKSVIPQRT